MLPRVPFLADPALCVLIGDWAKGTDSSAKYFVCCDWASVHAGRICYFVHGDEQAFFWTCHSFHSFLRLLGAVLQTKEHRDFGDAMEAMTFGCELPCATEAWDMRGHEHRLDRAIEPMLEQLNPGMTLSEDGLRLIGRMLRSVRDQFLTAMVAASDFEQVLCMIVPGELGTFLLEGMRKARAQVTERIDKDATLSYDVSHLGYAFCPVRACPDLATAVMLAEALDSLCAEIIAAVNYAKGRAITVGDITKAVQSDSDTNLLFSNCLE